MLNKRGVHVTTITFLSLHSCSTCLINMQHLLALLVCLCVSSSGCRVHMVRDKALGSRRPRWGRVRSPQLVCLTYPFRHLQGKYDEAGPLNIRAMEIAEKVIGPEHPTFARTLNNRAILLVKQVRNCGSFQKAVKSVVSRVDVEDTLKTPKWGHFIC